MVFNCEENNAILVVQQSASESLAALRQVRYTKGRDREIDGGEWVNALFGSDISKQEIRLKLLAPTTARGCFVSRGTDGDGSDKVGKFFCFATDKRVHFSNR